MSENLEPIIADDVMWGKTYYEMNKVDAVISEKNKEINGWKAAYSNLLNVEFEEIAEAFNAYQHGDKKQALKELAQVGAVVFRCMEHVQKEVEAGT